MGKGILFIMLFVVHYFFMEEFFAMAVIKDVFQYSPFRGKVKKGDDLIRINGKIIHDFLDYMYFSSEIADEDGEIPPQEVEITVRRGKKLLTFKEIVREGDLRLDFANYIMDEQKVCKNKCVFCFIDQMPPGMRDTLYYKDDDFRLSLIYGNYVTLTNLTDEELDRIISLRVSPLNLSVHTTNPELRVRMMANPNAAKIGENLKKLADAGINLRCQIVLCKGLNDGEELARTMEDLKALYPAVSSVSVVPVGLTKFREGLYPLQPLEKEDCRAVLEQVNAFGDRCVEELGTRLIYPSDEFYMKGEVPLPGYAYYEDFEQLENGVGMLISFAGEFAELMKYYKGSDAEIHISMATGVSVKPFFETIVKGLQKRFPNLRCHIYAIRNDFFGETITVSGLLTGQDILAQLKGKELGDYLLISQNMLRGNTFLDDMTTYKLGKELGVKIKKAGISAEDFVRAVASCKRKISK